MTSAKPKRRWFQFSLRTLLSVMTLLAAYFGAYTALSSPVTIVEESFSGIVVSGYREPDFRMGGIAAKVVFKPAVWLDRELHPSYWDRFSDFDSMPAEKRQ